MSAVLSVACSRGGDGQCDGIIPDDEPDGLNDCDCPCHTLWDPLDTIEAYRVWHTERDAANGGAS